MWRGLGAELSALLHEVKIQLKEEVRFKHGGDRDGNEDQVFF
jgi:hypothetical protein